MDLLTTLLICNLHGSDPALVRAITANSHANPYFVVDPAVDYTELDVPAEPKTQADALARSQEITAHGGKPLHGLLQLPTAWMTLFGRALPDAFDPCINVAIGTAMLSAFDSDCAHEQRASRPTDAPHSKPRALSSRRLCTIRKYGDAIGEPDFEELITLELQNPTRSALPPDPTDAPIFPALPPRSWGPDCLLVPLLPPDAGGAASAARLADAPRPPGP